MAVGNIPKTKAEAQAAFGATKPATATAQGTVLQGVAVDNAAGANPTAAEFQALLDSLRDAGVIASE